MLEKKINSIKEKTEVVVLPEMFSTGFSMKPDLYAEAMDGETMQWMKRVSAERRVVLTGSFMVAEQGHCYNRLIWMLPNGQFGIYDKRHLFANGSEDQHYVQGHKRLIASVKGWRINLQVCYDLRFPVWARQSLLPVDHEQEGNGQKEQKPAELEYDVLVYVANWPERRNHAWKTLLQARAIENQCFAIGVNRVGTDGNDHYYSGDTMLVDPMGHVMYHKAHEEDIATITIQRQELDDVRTKFPFYKDADPFMILH